MPFACSLLSRSFSQSLPRIFAKVLGLVHQVGSLQDRRVRLPLAEEERVGKLNDVGALARHLAEVLLLAELVGRKHRDGDAAVRALADVFRERDHRRVGLVRRRQRMAEADAEFLRRGGRGAERGGKRGAEREAAQSGALHEPNFHDRPPSFRGLSAPSHGAAALDPAPRRNLTAEPASRQMKSFKIVAPTTSSPLAGRGKPAPHTGDLPSRPRALTLKPFNIS